jgi:hypothetical protein
MEASQTMTAPGTISDPVLNTFPPSLDSELARFLLEHYGVQHLLALRNLLRGMRMGLPSGQTVAR